MKTTFKYILFLFIFINIVFQVYQQSNKKEFSGSKLKIFFKTAALIAATLAGLISNSVEPDVPNNSTSIERVLSNQEFNSIDGSHNSGKIIRTGNSTSLEFQQEVSDISSNDINEIILVKNDGILPGADGFTPKPNRYWRHPYGRPRMRGQDNLFPNIQGLGNIPGAPQFRFAPKVDTSFNAHGRNRGDQCPKFDMSKEYKTFVQEMESKRYSLDDVNSGLKRFEQLSTNPETDRIDQKSINEAKTIFQAEKENLVINARRPNLNKGEPNLDFVVDGPEPFRNVDVKNPIDPKEFPPAKKKPESIGKLGKRMGNKIIEQKEKNGYENVLHIVDLKKMPAELKEKLKNVIIETAGSSEGITFIN